MKSLERHPAEAVFGAQNAHVMHRMREAQRAVDWLIAKGFTVLSVKVRDRNPVIWIEGSSLCESLEGGVHVVKGAGAEREVVMAASVEGAQVQWRAS